MIQGTTPTHIFSLPFSASLLKEVEVTYAQKRSFAQQPEPVVSKGTEDCDLSGEQVSVTLTQDDTLLFNPSLATQVQLRVMTSGGQVLATRPHDIDVHWCLKGCAL